MTPDDTNPPEIDVADGATTPGELSPLLHASGAGSGLW